MYHFDLLMKTKAQCNRFGKRTGYAIIGNGTGFKQKKVDTKQADKVISKAKKYIGKVNYVFGASSPAVSYTHLGLHRANSTCLICTKVG